MDRGSPHSPGRHTKGVERLLSVDALVALVTLTAMELVLGIDNIVFLSLITSRLPVEQQALARRVGLTLALGMRLALLFTITWVMTLTQPLFSPLGHPVSGRDLILLGGGLFLIYKATTEIFDRLEGAEAHGAAAPRPGAFAATIAQIIVLDLVFSLDSVITAVGMANEIAVMVIAMVIAVGVMLVTANPLSAFVERHPTVKMLALAFLLLIGVMLVAEGSGQHIEKGYVYFAMAFSVFVELLNIRYRRKSAPVALHQPHSHAILSEPDAPPQPGPAASASGRATRP
jgi:predicted tellurium resistance membrane protein TerC